MAADRTPGGARAPSGMPLAALRAERAEARRALELAHMRSHQPASADADAIELLRLRADALTEELIGRYAADLGLVDSLLDEPYPRRVSAFSGRARGRRGSS